MIRTYVDAGILIATTRGDAESAKRSLEILDDPQREFAGKFTPLVGADVSSRLRTFLSP